MIRLVFFLYIMVIGKLLSAQPYLPLSAGSGNPLSGVLQSNVSADYFLSAVNGSTNNLYLRIGNSASFASFGVENSNGSSIVSGSSPYSVVVAQYYNSPLEFGTNNTIRYSITGSGNHDFKSGTATFGNTINANGNLIFGPGAYLSLNAGDIKYANNAGFGILSQNDERQFGVTNSGIAITNTLTVGGNVGIGTTYPSEKLSVNGKIRAKEVKVETTNWPDYVFAKDYSLPTLKEIEQHIAEKGHLPEIPSAEDVAKSGISLGEMNAKLLKKIEELTLYLIEQNKANKVQEDKIRNQQEMINDLMKEVRTLKANRH